MTYHMSADPRASQPTEPQRDRIVAALTHRGVLALQIDRITCTPSDEIPGYTHLARISVHGGPDWACWLSRDGSVADVKPVEIPA